MSATPLAPIAAPLHLQFEDNRLLPQLFGQHDQHLARIEQELGVSMVPRGNQLAISGQTDAVTVAKQVVTSLYQRLKRGIEIDAGEIDAALRLNRLDEGLEPNLFDGNGKDGTAIRTARRHITPRTAMQAKYMRMLHEHELVFGLGPAGTGKTYLAVAVAVAMLTKGAVDRIILSRPAVEAGERLGFLPGDMREKVDPYLRPLYDALYDVLLPEKVERDLETGVIEIAPLAFMRGRTLTNAFVILDEAQNTTTMQMKMFLTRLGEGSKMVVTGDPSQIDLPTGQRSGLDEAVNLLAHVPGIDIVRFANADIVRRDLVARVVEAYDRASLANQAQATQSKPPSSKPDQSKTS